jgi:hypothetical protein
MGIGTIATVFRYRRPVKVRGTSPDCHKIGRMTHDNRAIGMRINGSNDVAGMNFPRIGPRFLSMISS